MATEPKSSAELFGDEIWMTIEYKRYPNSREDFIRAINEQQREAGEFGGFEIRFSLPLDAGYCVLTKEHERTWLEIENEEVDCGDGGGEDVAKAIEDFFAPKP